MNKDDYRRDLAQQVKKKEMIQEKINNSERNKTLEYILVYKKKSDMVMTFFTRLIKKDWKRKTRLKKNLLKKITD